jgi:D-cysteine desulfhydrase family pyridoxal phosphate-dependent enzyme
VTRPGRPDPEHTVGPTGLGLAHLPTPLEPMDRLGAALASRGDGPRLLVKRDDCTGLALGGNKARKLELICREALAAGCDTLVTGGGAQSNHARMTAAAANRLGLECHLAMPPPAPSAPPVPESGNLLLDRVLGAHMHLLERGGYYDIEAGIETLAVRLASEGRTPFAIPVGGASVTGVTAYVRAADELLAQLGDERADWVVVADGSGGTHAGLLAGFTGRVQVLGVDVGTRPDLDEVVPALAAAAASASGRPAPPASAVVDHDHFGSGYGALTDGVVEAVLLAARSEGLVLDPVYTGKAMAGLVAAVRTGRIGAGETVVFWHTGGAPALFAGRYAAAFGEGTDDAGAGPRPDATGRTGA